MTLQGRPRMLILAPIESAYMISYWSSIVTFILSCRVSEILKLFYAEIHFSVHHLLLRPNFSDVPLE